MGCRPWHSAKLGCFVDGTWAPAWKCLWNLPPSGRCRRASLLEVDRDEVDGHPNLMPNTPAGGCLDKEWLHLEGRVLVKRLFLSFVYLSLCMCSSAGNKTGSDAGAPGQDTPGLDDAAAAPDQGRSMDASRDALTVRADLAATGADCSGTLRFVDPALEAAVRAAIGLPTGDIQSAQVTGLSKLEINQSVLADLSGIECLSALTSLRLTNTKVKDVTPLAKLTQLTGLDLSFSPVADLSPLASLSKLGVLSVGGCGSCNLHPQGLDVVASMPELYKLFLWGLGVSDLGAIGKCTKLYSLNLGVNDVRDVGPLARLTGLRSLTLYHNEVSDLSPLANLIGLTDLDLETNQVTDLTPLLPLTKLETLELERNPIDCAAQTSNLSTLKSRLGGFMSTDCK
jgi:hypothetical protein